MVTLSKASYQNQTRVSEFIGLSTEVKPDSNVENGSTFYCMDTQQLYMYDEQGQQWRLQ